MGRPAELLRDGDDLSLRRWRAGEAPVVHRVVSDSIEHLAPWMSWVANGYTEQEAVRFVESSRAKWDKAESFDYAISLPEAGPIGCCSLMNRIGGEGLEIGYWLSESYCGYGYMTRAAAALVHEAFRMGAGWVEIVHDSANVRSGAVPRRLGFTVVEQRPAPQPWTSGQEGTRIVWRRLPD